MNFLILWISSLLLILANITVFAAEENFILMDGITGLKILELGSHVNVRQTPCSTFKIALSLIGYEEGVLVDTQNPVWEYREGYADFLESWKRSLTPQSWIKHSCVWYSQVLAYQIGLEKIQAYLLLFDYGNQDLSGHADAWRNSPLKIAPQTWVNSTLKISPEEQSSFIRSMLLGELPISDHSLQMTKTILFCDELPNGWKLYGKTGGTVHDADDANPEIGWFVGWIEKNHIFYPFAYNILDRKVNHSMKIPKAKQLIIDSKILENKLD